jgi:hypothetical protein
MTVFLRPPFRGATNTLRLFHMTMNPIVQPSTVELDIPPAHPNDADLSLRDLIYERLSYGIRPTEPDIASIRVGGYTSYFMKLAKSPRRIGGPSFKKLREAGRLDLTTEYILFHRFRDRLEPDIRTRIAAILAESVSHPHARWESRSQC